MTKDTVQILYHPGTFGNLIRFILDRSLPDTKLKLIEYPFDKNENKTIHQTNFPWSKKFTTSHQLDFQNCDFVSHPHIPQAIKNEKRKPDPKMRKILVTHDDRDEVFVHRACFYRAIPAGTDPVDWTIARADPNFVKETFGSKIHRSEMVAKELLKIEFHSRQNILLKAHQALVKQAGNYHLNIRHLLDTDLLQHEIQTISDRFDLDLKSDKEWLRSIVSTIKTIKPVDTIDRCNEVYQAVVERRHVKCKDMDIVEQAWLETQFEKDHDNPQFPYGNGWFDSTDQINEYIDTYPSYLRNMNPRLPWHNGHRNPFYLTGKLNAK